MLAVRAAWLACAALAATCRALAATLPCLSPGPAPSSPHCPSSSSVSLSPLPWPRELKLGRRRVLVLHPFSAQAKRCRRIRLDLLHHRALLAVPSSALALLRLQAPAMAASMPGDHGRAAAHCYRPSPGQGMAAAGHVQGRRFSSAISGHQPAGFSTPQGRPRQFLCSVLRSRTEEGVKMRIETLLRVQMPNPRLI